MVINIGNTDDFIRALRENEEFQAAARRELLTQDLLELPKEFGEFRESTDERLDEIRGEFKEFRKSTDERFEEIGGEIKGIRGDIDGLGEAFRREVRAQSSFRGNYAQRASIDMVIHIAADLSRSLGMGRVKTRLVPRSMSETWLTEEYETVDALGLRERAWETFMVPDVLAEVRDLRAPNDSEPAFYIAVEASYTADVEDMLRATDHAKIVRAVTGRDAYPVVAAVLLDDRMDAETRGRLYDNPERFVNANDPDSALWFRLDSADLRPPEPY